MTTAEQYDWMTDAACIEIGTEAFFPAPVSSGPNRAATKATRICHEQCPVKTDCLQYALTNGLEHGIFGGLTARERRLLTRYPARGAATSVSDAA
jgi:WhiB family redox-sensing transcriptional regulator